MNKEVAVQTRVLAGAPNFRDLGGLPVSGGRVRHGLLFRSEALTDLTPKALAEIDSLGVRLVCDLRGADERERKPTPWPGEKPRVLAVKEGIDLYGSSEERIRTIYRDETGVSARELILGWYGEMHRIYEPVLRELFVALADRHELPALIHCTGGKDRTAFVAAMVLTALGASRSVVEADYLLTDQFFGSARLRRAVEVRLGHPPAGKVVESLRVNRRYLDTIFHSVEVEYGSVEKYLHHLGLSKERQERLHEALVA